MSKRVGLRLMGNPGGNRVITCEDVLECIENPDYSSYSELWDVVDPESKNTAYLNGYLRYSGGNVFAWDSDNNRVIIFAIADGSHIASVDGKTGGVYATAFFAGSFREYFCVWEDGVGLKVYKGSTLIGTYLTDIKDSAYPYVAMSPDAKYILIVDNDESPTRWYLLEGSE